MGTYTLQPRDEGPDSCCPCGCLCRQTPIHGDPLGGRRIPGNAPVPRLQDAGRARQASQGRPGGGQLSEPPYTPYADDAQPRDAQASGSNAYNAPAPHAGPDHVDYGAYTGGYGAFGWYTDHPVLLTGH